MLKIGVGAAGAIALGVHGSADAAPGSIPDAARVAAPREWFEQLVKPGETIVYAGEQLTNLIFPLGGIGTGSVWLHGSGRLVNWQIFNNIQKNALVDDTFLAVRVEQEGRPAETRVLQQQSVGPLKAIQDIRFVGQYPVAKLSLVDKTLPVEIEAEAFNPLIPLDEKSSAIPCAVFTVRATNRTDRPVRVSFLASLQNAVGHAGTGPSLGVSHPTYGGNVNRMVRQGGATAIAMSAIPGQPAEVAPAMEILTDASDFSLFSEAPVIGLSVITPGRQRLRATAKPVYWLTRGDLRQFGASLLQQVVTDVREHGAVLMLSGDRNGLTRPVRATVSSGTIRRETVFESFDSESFGRWVPKGKAFKRPRPGTAVEQNLVSGFVGSGLVNTYDPSDAPRGSLTSPEFTIKERFISLLVGGGEFPGSCGVNLMVDGKTVRTVSGKNSEHLERVEWDVADLVEKDARIEIVDQQTGGWGHTLVDDVRFSNLPIDAITEEDARAWNALLDALAQAVPMTPAGLGNGKVLIVPVELGGALTGVDGIVHRDRVLAMLAGLAEVKYRPATGRPATAPSFGTMCLATPDANASVQVGWTDRIALGRAFAEKGSLDQLEISSLQETPSAGPSGPGETVNGALCVEATAAAKATAQATFVMSWHFPHQYYPQNKWRAVENTVPDVGNMYAAWHHDAQNVALSVLTDMERLRKGTMDFRDMMYDTSLPQYLVDAAAANISILRSPTCFWTADGTFYGFEGCNTAGGGCCPMNCNHVWNYEQTLAKLWPALERNMRVTELKYHQLPNGGAHHRVAVPRDNPDKGAGPVADGQCGAVLKAYREHLQSPDRRFLDEMWPMVKKAMDFAISEWDADGDGVMEKPQFNTYDRVIYGHNTFVTSLYLAALRAAEEMARLVKDAASAGRYRGLFEKGRKFCATQLFDGEYYLQKAENINLGYGKGCLADQVVGQWWARVLNLGDVLPAEQVRSALKAIFKHNFLWTQEGFEGTQRYLQFADGKDKGLLVGSWPKGGRPEDPILYRDEIWTGVEYQVAAHKIYEGQVEEGLAIVKGARERYDGRKKSPWNEIECGDYYARALSSWSLLLAAQGYFYDGPARVLGFNPRLSPADHRSFFTATEGWGRFTQKRTDQVQTNSLSLAGGRMDLRELRLALPAQAKTAQGQSRLGDRELMADVKFMDGAAVVTLHAPITVQAGETLSVGLKWA